MNLVGGSLDELEALANSASHRGLLVFMNAGGVKEVRFPGYLTPEEEKIARRSRMSSKVAKLVSAYRQHLTVPWQAGLAAIQRVIFAVYDKADELRLRANVEEFALATQQAGKQWLLLDLTNAFPEWMAAQEYRDAYFESPEDLAGYQAGELTEFIADLNAS
jgi:hypothetical protein